MRRCRRLSFFSIIAFLLLGSASCVKNLPDKNIVYFNDFENNKQDSLKIEHLRPDSITIVNFNGTKVFGRFNNNHIQLSLAALPDHNALKVEFDLYIHDLWNGDYLIPGGNNIPDVWQMQIDHNPVYITTFSNNAYPQSFPNNYQPGGVSSGPARGNSWNTNLPGVCALQGNSNGSTLYKIEYTTGHTSSSFALDCNDALQPSNSLCQKSWSIDNLRITAIKYKY